MARMMKNIINSCVLYRVWDVEGRAGASSGSGWWNFFSTWGGAVAMNWLSITISSFLRLPSEAFITIFVKERRPENLKCRRLQRRKGNIHGGTEWRKFIIFPVRRLLLCAMSGCRSISHNRASHHGNLLPEKSLCALCLHFAGKSNNI